MNHRIINRSVVNLLRFLSDDGNLKVTQNKHIKVTGMFEGVEKVYTLSTSPSNIYYEKSQRSSLRRFIQSLNIEDSDHQKINKIYPHIL